MQVEMSLKEMIITYLERGWQRAVYISCKCLQTDGNTTASATDHRVNVNWLDYVERGSTDEVDRTMDQTDPKEEKYYSLYFPLPYTWIIQGNNIDKQDTVILNATTLPGNQDKIFNSCHTRLLA